jgi:uncharacterized protein
LRPFWAKYFDYSWKFGATILFIVCIIRFVLVLDANRNGNYNYIGAIMAFSAIAPFVFLTKYGRIEIGIKSSKNYKWLLVALIVGLIASAVLYFIGKVLYDATFSNWYVYIAKSYKIPASLDDQGRKIMFAIMALVGMTYSPIGEEFFFRGIVHSSIAKSIGERKASIVDSAAFALTHISHFGLVFINDQWRFFLLPTIIWVASMYFLSMIFIHFKHKTGSLLGPVISHAAFNLGMIFCIFYLF